MIDVWYDENAGCYVAFFRGYVGMGPSREEAIFDLGCSYGIMEVLRA